MYAIIETGGKQYKVQEGDIIFTEKLNIVNDQTVTFENVLAVSTKDGLEVGTPFVKDATVKAKVLGQVKGDKIIVFKYKPKKNYKRKQGHRQPYTKIQIEKISV